MSIVETTMYSLDLLLEAPILRPTFLLQASHVLPLSPIPPLIMSILMYAHFPNFLQL